MDYNTLRHFADSWGLLAMTLFFLFVIAYTFRPGSKKRAEEVQAILFKDEAND
ncbi:MULTISPECIES: cbb3-type cytochrome oxidase subunit 3 [Paenochrobactrum]|uniref:Cytochrome c oxidase cbb3-type subunit 4 n=2 Tax=Paenochrobactrum TaxID=999488 RepID=A0A841LZ93_9HYPH|nr:cbb3-type cytochrome c oxidase subunit 3 [Paenochrobactrum gallinarii]MBB6261842.1 cytochrome c oxidase cbb3-type subunit 4 [Paenochrobactrum gallinarii]